MKKVKCFMCGTALNLTPAKDEKEGVYEVDECMSCHERTWDTAWEEGFYQGQLEAAPE